MSHRQATAAQLEQALARVEEAQLAVSALRASLHDVGQTWTTGVLPSGEHTYDRPDPVFAEAHRLWRLAVQALERSGHILIMAAVGGEPAPIPDELKP